MKSVVALVLVAVVTAAAATSAQLGPRVYSVYRVDIDPTTGHARGPMRVLRSAASFPRVSPDGQTLAYVDTAGGPATRVLRLANTSNGSDRVPGESAVSAAAVVGWRSPEAVLVFSEATGTLVTVDSKTGTTSPVAQFGEYVVPPFASYVGASDELLYLSGPARVGSQIMSLALGTGAKRSIATSDFLLSLASSADGKVIAYSRRQAAGMSACEIRLLGEAEPIRVSAPKCDEGDEVFLYGLSPDGRYLVFHDPFESIKLRMMNVRTRETWPVSEGEGQPVWGVVNGIMGSVSWAPDGSFFLAFGSAAPAEPVWSGR